MTRAFEPHPYQNEAIQHLYSTPRAALWMPMGGGKTVSTLTALVNLSLVEDIFPVLVLAPLRVARTTWPEEVTKWEHLAHLRVSVVTGTAKERLSAIRSPADIYACNYDNLQWLVEELGEAWPFKTVIADECFVAGTLVETPGGPRPIEEIRVGDFVFTHAGPRRVVRAQTKLTNTLNLVRLKTPDGGEIVVTGNHPFFTDAGWLPARACGGRKLYGAADLSDLSRSLREGAHKSAGTVSETENTILLAELPHEGDIPLQRSSSGDEPGNYEGAKCRQNLLLELWSAMVRCPSGERLEGAEGKAFSSFPGRKRHRPVSYRGADSTTYAGRLYMELCNSVGEFWAGLSFSLQTGLWEPGDQSVSGSGRGLASHGAGTGTRRKEERETSAVRVESFPHNQRNGMVAVFNLEVEGAPTFFANGYLVHNCTRLKSFRIRQGSKRAGALGKVAHTKVSRFIGLTGTPSPNGLADLWGQTWFLDQGARLGRTYSAFSDRWFQKGYDGYSLKPLPTAQPEIEGRLKDICLTVNALPVDEPIHNQIRVDLPPAARKLYRDMEKEMFAQIDEHGVEALNAAAKTMKCLQLANGAIYTDDQGSWTGVHDAKLEALESVIEEAAGAPVLVAYHFKSDLQRLRKAFPKGRVLDKDPATIAQWNRGEIPLLFAHPACLHPETEVLTEHRGWVRIIDVTRTDRVFDGVEFVSHNGCSFSGVKTVIDLFGVTMTPEHKLLIGGVWTEAKAVRDPESARREALYAYAGDDAYLSAMLPLRRGTGDRAATREQGKSAETETLPNLRGDHVSQDDRHAVLRDMARDEGAGYRSRERGLRALWRRWSRRIRGLASVRELLSGHVFDVRRQPDHRKSGQLAGLQQAKLPMGFKHGATGEQDEQPGNPLSRPRYAFSGVLPGNGLQQGRGNPSSKQRDDGGRGASRLSQIDVPKEPQISEVYDLVDCGPRSRFVVRNAAGEVFVSHNSAGHGLNLADGGNTLVFFSLNWNLEEHMQIIERIGPMRQKQAGYKRPVFVHYIMARQTVDSMVLERLQSKKSVQEILVEAMKRKATS